MADNFNYDGDDGELDDNGLPEDIITDDEEDSGGSDLSDTISDIRDAYQKRKNKKGKNKGQNKQTNQLDNMHDLDHYKNNLDDAKKVLDKNKNLNSPKGTNNLSSGIDKASNSTKQIANSANKISNAKQTAETAKNVKQSAEAVKNAAETLRTVKDTTQALTTATETVKGGAGIASCWPAAIVILVILVLIILFMIAYGVAAAYDRKTSEETLKNNTYIADDYFYGIRTAYADTELLMNSLQLSYKKYIVQILTNLDENSEVKITVQLPEESFNNETEISSTIVNMSIALASTAAYNEALYEGMSFSHIYSDIDYFGITTDQSTIFNDFLAKYLKSNALVKNEDGSSLSSTFDLKAEIKDITENDLKYMFNLCEKVMIKDLISTDSGIEGFERAKYIGSVYMAKTTTTLSNMSYIINNQYVDKTASIKLIEINDSTETTLLDKTIEENADSVVVAYPSNKKSVTLDKFTSIDENNLQLFSEGLSLFDAIKLLDEEQEYFKQIEVSSNGTTVTVYTWKPTDEKALYLEFTSNNPFMYGEFDIKVA